MDPTGNSPKTDTTTTIIKANSRYERITENIKSAINILKKSKPKIGSRKPISITKFSPSHLISIKTNTGKSLPLLVISRILSMSSINWMILNKSPVLAILQNIIIVKSILDIANAVSIKTESIPTNITEENLAPIVNSKLIQSQERISKLSFIMANFANMLSSSSKPSQMAPGISTTLSYMLLTSNINISFNDIKQKTNTPLIKSIFALSKASGYEKSNHIFEDIGKLNKIIITQNSSVKSGEHQLSDILSLISSGIKEISPFISKDIKLNDVCENYSEYTENIHKNILLKLKSEVLNISIKEEIVLKNEFLKKKLDSIKELINKAEICVSETIESQETHENNKQSKDVLHDNTKKTNRTKSFDIIKTKTLPFETLITAQKHIISVIPQNISIVDDKYDEEDKEEEIKEEMEEEKEDKRDKEKEEEQKDEEKEEIKTDKDIYDSKSVIKWKFGPKKQK